MTQQTLRAQDTPQDGKVVLNAPRLKALRKQRGLSQDGLAQLCMESRLCVSIASIKRAETGKPVLYRTASHLARVFASDLDELVSSSSTLSGPAPAIATVNALEQRTVLGLALIMAAPLPPQVEVLARQLISDSGGQYQHAGLAIFGLPKAHGSDALRCLRCATGLAPLLQGHGAALIIRHIRWPGDGAADPLAADAFRATATASASISASIYIEACIGAQLGQRFSFVAAGDPAAGDPAAAGWLRLVDEHRTAQTPAYPLIGRHVELQQYKATLATTLAYQAGHILYLRGVAGIGKSRLIQEFAEIARQSGFECHSAVVPDLGVQGDRSPDAARPCRAASRTWCRPSSTACRRGSATACG